MIANTASALPGTQLELLRQTRGSPSMPFSSRVLRQAAYTSRNSIAERTWCARCDPRAHRIAEAIYRRRPRSWTSPGFLPRVVCTHLGQTRAGRSRGLRDAIAEKGG